MADPGGASVLMFDRIAAVLVTAWFLAGLWLVVQSLLVPGRPVPGRDGMPE